MKMMTKEIAVGLAAADAVVIETGESPDKVLVKYFTPWANATWWVVSGTPLDAVNGAPMSPEAIEFEGVENAKDWHLFGFADIGMPDCAELGYVLLSELESIKGPVGLKIERDLHYSGSLAEVRAGYAVAA